MMKAYFSKLFRQALFLVHIIKLKGEEGIEWQQSIKMALQLGPFPVELSTLEDPVLFLPYRSQKRQQDPVQTIKVQLPQLKLACPG